MTQAHRRAVRWVVPGYALILAVAVTAPLLAPGYLLLRDAVSTPRSYLSDAALGLSEAAPRAVPQDFLVAVLSAVVDGGVLVKALVLAGLFLAGWGAARLAAAVVPEAGVAGQLVATTLAVWNPYVAERLLQGHWSLLVGYGCLPWVATAVLRLRTAEDPRWPDWAAAVFWIAVAGLTPTGLLLAAVVAGVCVVVSGGGVSRPRCAAGLLAAAVVTALPWLTASALGSALGTSPPSGLAAFAARAEPGLGTLGSLAGLGGIWNAEAVPGSRTTLLAFVGTAVLLAVVALGLPAVIRRPAAAALLLLAAVAVVAPALAATGPGLTVLRSVVDAAPGLGVLRDGQKWVALALPGYAIAGAGAVLTAGRWLRPGLAALIAVVALVAVLPDLAWGVGGKVAPVQYPAGWTTVAEAVNADPGAVLVLPADTMRRFPWAGPAPVLDPLPRWLRPEVLTTGDLTVSGQTVLGEGSRARQIQRIALAGAKPGELAEAGVRWVVIERGTAGEMGNAEQTLRGLPVTYQDADLALYHIGGTSPVAAQGNRRVQIAVHLAWVALLGMSGIALAVSSLRRRSR